MSVVPTESPILDLSGRPIRTMQTAHYGADPVAPELRGWSPREYSADGELLPELQTLRARTADLIRNHGLTSGAVQTHLDNIIGPNLQLVLKPDHAQLGITAKAAADWAHMVEAKFRGWAYDLDCYCDAARRHMLPGLLSMAYRSYLTSFEALSTIEWLPNRGGKYATAVQAIDPARLSNPDGTTNDEHLREGVRLGAMGEPIGYYIANQLAFDRFTGSRVRAWTYVPRETPWGRQLVVHVFDGDRPGQSRGRSGIVSVIAKIKMLEKFEQSSLQAAILNAMYAAVIESPMEWEAVGAALGARNERARVADPLEAYMGQRAQWHKDSTIRYNGVRIPHLYPGEALKINNPSHPSAQFSQFQEAVIRHLAGGFNMTYEQFSRDYSKTNYSSARAAMLEAWRFFTGRRHFIAARIATAYFAAWLEEAMDSGEVETPAGAPSFWEAKAAYTNCKWIGPGRGHIDPQKEAAATGLELQNGTTTLEKECAERGLDWMEVLQQRAAERARIAELEAEYGVSLGLGASSAPAQAAPDDDEDPDADPADDDGELTEEEIAERRGDDPEQRGDDDDTDDDAE